MQLPAKIPVLSGNSFSLTMQTILDLRLLLCLVVALVIGCGSPPTHVPGPEVEPLMYLLNAYMDATNELKHPPENLAELKKFLPDGDKWLTSPRDGQPYVIHWGVSVHDPDLDPANPPLIAYEQQGQGGVRQAINVMGLTELTEEEFSKLSPK